MHRRPARLISGEFEPYRSRHALSPDLAALERALSDDAARELPPFGADSVRRARTLGPAATPVLQAHVQARGDDALLALEALRVADPAGYQAQPGAARAAIYVAALGKGRYFNTWGQPGMALTDTARALAALGNDAVAALAPLLADQRPAPSSGSQDATLAQMNGNRVCDYAWVLIHEARGTEYVYASAPADRDREISALRAALANRP